MEKLVVLHLCSVIDNIAATINLKLSRHDRFSRSVITDQYPGQIGPVFPILQLIMRLGVGLRYDIMVILRDNGCIQRKSKLAHCLLTASGTLSARRTCSAAADSKHASTLLNLPAPGTQSRCQTSQITAISYLHDRYSA